MGKRFALLAVGAACVCGASAFSVPPGIARLDVARSSARVVPQVRGPRRAAAGSVSMNADHDILLRAAKDGVKKHPLLLSMNAWALQFAHNIAMCANMLVMPFGGDPSYVLGGVPANFWPFGDVPFLFLLWAVNIYLMKKVFGSYCP